MTGRKTAGELANQALKDNTKYDARELALAVCDDLEEQLYKAAENYDKQITQDEFCIVMVLATDSMIKTMKRRKFYCWPWLPKPRPNQSVFLYNRAKQKITKRLWVLPSAEVMAELSTSDLIVHKRYQTMRDWSVAFYKQKFWEFIRYEHDIKMLSQEEHFKLHDTELSEPEVDDVDSLIPETFDFDKIRCGDVLNPSNPALKEDGLDSTGET